VRNVFYGIITDSLVRTGINAKLTPRTFLPIQNHNAIVSFENGLIRTGIHTRRLITMPADIHMKNKIQFILDHGGTDFLHRDQLDTIGRRELLFAGDLTGFASPAEFMVNNEGVFRHLEFPLKKLVLLQSNI
jgi:hypothetical protein